MFNLIGEIKKEYNLPFTCEYNLLNISGKALYVEGHEGVIKFSKELISFKTKKGVVVVEGDGLNLKVLSSTTLCIEGKIKKTEVF